MGKKVLLTNAAVAAPSPTVDYSASTVSNCGNRVLQAFGTVSTATGAAQVDLEGSMDGTNWTALGSINLTLGTAATNGKASSNEAWPYMRANLKSISGTGAVVSASLAD